MAAAPEQKPLHPACGDDVKDAAPAHPAGGNVQGVGPTQEPPQSVAEAMDAASSAMDDGSLDAASGFGAVRTPSSAFGIGKRPNALGSAPGGVKHWIFVWLAGLPPDVPLNAFVWQEARRLEAGSRHPALPVMVDVAVQVPSPMPPRSVPPEWLQLNLPKPPPPPSAAATEALAQATEKAPPPFLPPDQFYSDV